MKISMLSNTFKRIIFILGRFDRPLTISEIQLLLKRYGIDISQDKIRNSIKYYKSKYLITIPIDHSSKERLSYFLNQEGERLAESLFMPHSQALLKQFIRDRKSIKEIDNVEE